MGSSNIGRASAGAAIALTPLTRISSVKHVVEFRKGFEMFDTLDRIVNLDIGKRGVDKLYAPARARCDEPLSAAAARSLTDLAAGDRVVLVTGSLTRPWVSMKIGETDGPVGTAALARTLSYGFNAIPVVVTDTSLLEPIGATLR